VLPSNFNMFKAGGTATSLNNLSQCSTNLNMKSFII